MSVVEIPLSPEQQTRLRELAVRAGLTGEEYLRRRVQMLLAERSIEAEDEVNTILERNAELYRRLA